MAERPVWPESPNATVVPLTPIVRTT